MKEKILFETIKLETTINSKDNFFILDQAQGYLEQILKGCIAKEIIILFEV